MSNVEYQSNEMIFEWDSEKAKLNWQKHSIRFEDATKVFDDENRIERRDDKHSDDEERYITIGKVRKVLFVVYTERSEIVRLISARPATSNERSEYYAGSESY